MHGLLYQLKKYTDEHMHTHTHTLTQKLEINPEHPIFQKLLNARMQNPDLADLIVEQVFDNALVAADLMDSPRAMLPRLNKLLDTVVGNPKPYTEE